MRSDKVHKSGLRSRVTGQGQRSSQPKSNSTDVKESIKIIILVGGLILTSSYTGKTLNVSCLQRKNAPRTSNIMLIAVRVTPVLIIDSGPYCDPVSAERSDKSDHSLG